MLWGSVILPDGDRIRVLIATAAAELRAGLKSKRPCADEGMLFVYPKPQASTFSMDGVDVPLDIIWINQGLRIVHIIREARPCPGPPCPRYRSPIPAQYVLELQGGQASKHGLCVSQTVRL
jgi:uncharacterized protein